jgi:hypothetical protein
MQKINSLAVGESVRIREHVILRIQNGRREDANAFGWAVGSVTAIGELVWVGRSALHALSGALSQ